MVMNVLGKGISWGGGTGSGTFVRCSGGAESEGSALVRCRAILD